MSLDLIFKINSKVQYREESMYQKIETENKNSLKQCSVGCVCVKHLLSSPRSVLLNKVNH